MKHDIHRKLVEMKMLGMADKLQDMMGAGGASQLSNEEFVSHLVESEYLRRKNSRMQSLLRQAKIKQSTACVEDLEFGQERGLKKTELSQLLSLEFLERHHNVLIAGLTGTGKSYLASALCNLACRNGFSAAYYRLSRLLEQLMQDKLLGNYLKTLEKLGKVRVLVLDDLGPDVMTKEQRQAFFELVEERHQTGSTILTSQLPLDKWYGVFGEPTSADAICDRLFHQAHKLQLKGASRRKK